MPQSPQTASHDVGVLGTREKQRLREKDTQQVWRLERMERKKKKERSARGSSKSAGKEEKTSKIRNADSTVAREEGVKRE